MSEQGLIEWYVYILVAISAGLGTWITSYFKEKGKDSPATTTAHTDSNKSVMVYYCYSADARIHHEKGSHAITGYLLNKC